MKRRAIPPTGELRQSQLITTFGPGAMVDLPDHSVLIGGLETWRGDKEEIFEDRLLNKLRADLRAPQLKLFAPPVDSDDFGARRTGIAAFKFPEWFLGQVQENWKDPRSGRMYRTRPLIPYTRLVKGKYQDDRRKLHSVVPVRFVQACVRGHLSDIDWYAFVQRNFEPDRTGQLWFDEGGSGNDFAEIFVRDTKTGARRPLSDARLPDSHVFGRCNGRKPWLGPRVWEQCDKHARLLTRAASNGYFTQVASVISIPEGDELLREAVDRAWQDHLEYCEELRDVRKERRREKVKNALEGFTDDQVWAEVSRRLNNTPTERKHIKQAELETLLAQKDTIGEDRPEGDFYARTHPLPPLQAPLEGKLGKLVLVHRLREVVAQVGFTRFEPTYTTIEGELEIGVELAPLARELTWLPAYQNRGEGVFLSFPTEMIERWMRRPGLAARARELSDGYTEFALDRGTEQPFVGLPYMMLHSLAHLLITAVALDCGYSASSIRERIYATGGDSGYGILLYTGSPGAEGTLGGLVDIGRNIDRHILRALELGRLCSNDPVCAQHDPSSRNEARYLHGAACHGCLLIAETSCERRNQFLDRALVVPTVTHPDAAYFGDWR